MTDDRVLAMLYLQAAALGVPARLIRDPNVIDGDDLIREVKPDVPLVD